MDKYHMTPSEAAAFALALLTNESNPGEQMEFIYRDACSFLEDAGVVVTSEERDHGRGAYDYQVEVCSPVQCTGRDAFAVVGIEDTEWYALISALESLFSEERWA